MTHAKTGASAIVFACVCLVVSACEKKEPPRPVVIEPTYAQDPSIQAGRTPSDAAAPLGTIRSATEATTSMTALDLALAADSGPRTYTRTQRIETTIPVDPDQAILSAAHMRAASCYDGKIVSNVPRSATITVTVIPTGKVTRAEVRSTDTTEPDVLACLKALGEGLVFTERFEQPQKRNTADTNGGQKPPVPSSNGGGLRTYAIDVAVVPGH